MKIKNLIKSVLLFLLCFIQLQFTIAQSKPNIVIIMTDQQFGDAMSCVMGDEFLHTPNMDLLAKEGVRFTNAYTPNPLCLPMRTCMATGLYPHETGVLANNNKKIQTDEYSFMGKLFKDAGYETGYFGKWHIALKEEEKDIHGFDIMFPKSNLDAAPAIEFIKQKHDKPFFAVASFLSPHEICQWARKEELPGGPIDALPALDKLPPLKANFSIPQNETDIMAFMRKSYHANRRFPVGAYTNEDWRRLLWGYYRLIERADAFVGEITNALKASGQEKNTLLVFLSDHGDCAGSHQWNQKTVFYDESSRVPFIIQWKGKIPSTTSDILVNTGLDMIPTLCDFAGIDIPSGLHGKSLMAPVLGLTPNWTREFVVSENHMVQGDPVDDQAMQPHGRMVRSEHFKYCLYSEGTERESLVDLQFDPGELVNQAKNPIYKNILEQHRAYLQKHGKETKDEMALEMLEQLK
jgi:arylsulfatase A-like enzyme